MIPPSASLLTVAVTKTFVPEFFPSSSLNNWSGIAYSDEEEGGAREIKDCCALGFLQPLKTYLQAHQSSLQFAAEQIIDGVM